jgi:hypothetical protein
MVVRILVLIGAFLLMACISATFSAIVIGLGLAVFLLSGGEANWTFVTLAWACITLGVTAKVIPEIFMAQPKRVWPPPENQGRGGMWRRG